MRKGGREREREEKREEGRERGKLSEDEWEVSITNCFIDVTLS